MFTYVYVNDIFLVPLFRDKVHPIYKVCLWISNTGHIVNAHIWLQCDTGTDLCFSKNINMFTNDKVNSGMLVNQMERVTQTSRQILFVDKCTSTKRADLKLLNSKTYQATVQLFFLLEELQVWHTQVQVNLHNAKKTSQRPMCNTGMHPIRIKDCLFNRPKAASRQLYRWWVWSRSEHRKIKL